MLYSIVSFLILLIEIFCIFLFFVTAKREHKAVSKSTLWYFAPVLALLAVLYGMAEHYNGVSLDFYGVLALLDTSIDAFGCSIDMDIVQPLLDANRMFSAAFMGACILAGFTTVSGVFGLAGHFFANTFRKWRAFLFGCDILVGSDARHLLYHKNSRARTLLWLEREPSEQERRTYQNAKLAYFVSKFDKETLAARLGRFARYNFILLQKDNDTVRLVLEYEAFMENEKANAHLYMEYDALHNRAIREYIFSQTKESDYIGTHIHFFDRYELIAKQFIQEHPATAHLPASFIDTETATIAQGKSLSVFYVGFGKVSQALFSHMVMNDQLVTIAENRLAPFTVSYHAFDCNSPALADRDNAFSCVRSLRTLNPDAYFPLPATPYSFQPHKTNIETAEGLTEVLGSYCADENHYSRFVISLADDLSNLDYAMRLRDLLNEQGAVHYDIFVRMQKKLACKTVLGHIHFFAEEERIFTHRCIVDEATAQTAANLDRTYQNLRVGGGTYALPAEQTTASATKAVCNQFYAINMRLKYNMLGLDLLPNNRRLWRKHRAAVAALRAKFADYTTASLQQMPYEKFCFGTEEKPHPAKAIAYQEKLRWNAFYLMHGFAPMPKSELCFQKTVKTDRYGVETIGYRVTKDDFARKLHGCLTSVEGLDLYHRYCAEQIAAVTGGDADTILQEFQTYQYDYLFVGELHKAGRRSKLLPVQKN